MHRLWLSGEGQLCQLASWPWLARLLVCATAKATSHKLSPGTPGGCPAAIARIGGSEAHLFSSVSLRSLIVLEPLAISIASTTDG